MQDVQVCNNVCQNIMSLPSLSWRLQTASAMHFKCLDKKFIHNNFNNCLNSKAVFTFTNVCVCLFVVFLHNRNQFVAQWGPLRLSRVRPTFTCTLHLRYFWVYSDFQKTLYTWDSYLSVISIKPISLIQFWNIPRERTKKKEKKGK